MKTIAILFTLFYFLNALAVAPYGIKGQQQTSTLYSNVHQFPNNQVTNMGGIDAVVETGNSNILSNPSFEHLTANTSWTDNGTATGIGTAVAVISGKKAYGFLPTAQTINLTQSSTLYQAQFADGVQGLAMVRIKSDVALKVCSIQAGTVSTTNCVNTNTDSKWGLYKVPFILGATSNGISISSTGVSVTGSTVIVDDAFVGAVDLKADVPTVRSQASTATGSLGAGVAFTGSFTTTGSGIYTDSSGVITVTKKSSFNIAFSLTSTTTTTVVPEIRINSVATSGDNSPVVAGQKASSSYNAVLDPGATISFANSGPGAASASNISITSTSVENGSVYSSNNADTDWASCGHTAASFTGFGTVTAIETQCKRQGGDLLMKGKLTAGIVTAVEARISLPVWNGLQLSSAGSSIIPSLQIAGDAAINQQSATYFRSSTLIEPSVSYITIGVQTATQNAITKATGVQSVTASNPFAFTARIPINGWNNSNIIIGSFNGLQSCTDTLACTDTFSATISSSGTVVSGSENVDWINGNCTTAVAGINTDYTCSYVTGLVSQPMNCVSVDTNSSTNPNATRVYTSTSSQFQASNLTGRGINIICQKQGVDYIGKTAMAVASDQNLRTPGLTNGIVLSATVGSSSSTACTATPCAYVDQTGGYISSVTRSSLGNYVINFNKTFTSLKCNHTQLVAVNAGVIIGAVCVNCNSITINARNFVPAAQDAGWDTICTGY